MTQDVKQNQFLKKLRFDKRVNDRASKQTHVKFQYVISQYREDASVDGVLVSIPIEVNLRKDWRKHERCRMACTAGDRKWHKEFRWSLG